jgi:glycosyltransferase involved in cell wall biosynthesis
MDYAKIIAMVNLFQERQSEKISVIMPVYNGAKFMDKTIAQIKAQTFVDYKCYMIDDFSSDDSVKVIESAIKGDDRFVLVKNQKNLGKPETLNKGLGLARGEYVLMLDDDDEYLPTMFEKLYKRAVDGGLDIVVCGLGQYDLESETYNMNVLNFSGTSERKTYKFNNLPHDEFPLKKLYSVVWNKLFRRDFLQKNQLKFEDYFPSDDMLFVAKALVLARKIGVVKEDLIVWKINDSKSGMGSVVKNASKILATLEQVEKFIKKNKLYKVWEKQFFGYVVDQIDYVLDILAFSEHGEKLFLETKKYLELLNKCGWPIDDGLGKIFRESANFSEYQRRKTLRAKNIIAYNEARIQDLENQLAAVKNSRSYRLGRALTAPIRVFKS